MATLAVFMRADIDADAITADSSTIVGTCPITGDVTSVKFIPNADKSGADTNTRTLTLYNDGQADGDSPVSVATFAMISGTDLDQGVASTFTLSATEANLDVTAGDVLRLSSDHASSGLTQPGGQIEIGITPAGGGAHTGLDRS